MQSLPRGRWPLLFGFEDVVQGEGGKVVVYQFAAKVSIHILTVWKSSG